MAQTDPAATATGGPRTARGRRTRERLLEAAGQVFVREGFLDSKITDITAEAGLGNGTFYNYFDTKEAILEAVVRQMIDRLYEAASPPPSAERNPVLRLELATRAFVRAFQEHVGLLAIFEQAATFSPEIRALRIQVRHTFRDRAARGIARLQEQGAADRDLSPQSTAEALTSMMSNLCYVWLILGEPYDEDEIVQTLTVLWARGIGLDVSAST